jgi:hypothetical protein
MEATSSYQLHFPISRAASKAGKLNLVQQLAMFEWVVAVVISAELACNFFT